MKNYFVEIADSNEVVAAFFNNDNLHIKTFLQLVKYAHAIDEDIAIRYNESIIGASKIDSVFYFYVVNQDNHFYIKYKHLPEKTPYYISADAFADMKKECRKAIEYVAEQEIASITPAETKTGDTPVFTPTSGKKDKQSSEPTVVIIDPLQDEFLLEIDKEFRQFYGFFEEHKDIAIAHCPFPKRVINALARKEIHTLGDLVDVSILDLSKIRWLGQKSIYSILQVCRSMYEDSDILDEAGQKPTQENERLNEWEKVRISVLKALEEGDASIDLNLEQGLLVRIVNFKNNIENQLKDIAESTERITKREKDILIRCLMLDETYGIIGKDYGVTRERIRQIKNKAIRKIRWAIFNHHVKPGIVDGITDLFVTAEKGELCWYLSYLKKNRKDTWECICPIISDKNDLSQIEIDLDPYKVNSGVAYGRRVNKGKRDFYITKEEKTRVVISETSLPVTTIVRNINNVVDTTKVKKLSYESVLKWLIAHGYIYEEKTTEQIIRHPTVKGIENRIIVDGRPSQTKGIYYITYYPPSIQRLIVEHANEMS